MRVISTTGRTFDFSTEPCSTWAFASGTGTAWTPSGAAKVEAPSFRKACGLAKLTRRSLQRAVAGIALAAIGLHHQHALAIDGDVERPAGLLDRALAHVVPAHAVLHEA